MRVNKSVNDFSLVILAEHQRPYLSHPIGKFSLIENPFFSMALEWFHIAPSLESFVCCYEDITFCSRSLHCSPQMSICLLSSHYPQFILQTFSHAFTAILSCPS